MPRKGELQQVTEIEYKKNKKNKKKGKRTAYKELACWISVSNTLKESL